jgi:hypothetical protein
VQFDESRARGHEVRLLAQRVDMGAAAVQAVGSDAVFVDRKTGQPEVADQRV